MITSSTILLIKSSDVLIVSFVGKFDSLLVSGLTP